MNKHYSTLLTALLLCLIWLLGLNQASANSPSLVDSVDLEISLSNPPSTPIYTSYAMELMVTNTGNQTATGVEIKFAKPTTGVTYLGGNEYVVTQGTFNPYNGEVWYVGDVLPNDTQTIQVNYYLLQDSIPISYAQVIALNEDDVDSTPNNGTPPSVNEDDEASTAPPTNGPIICTGNVILESQAEVDAFQGCEIIEGSLIIRSVLANPFVSSDITDLSPLLSIKEVRGDISFFNNDQLIDLHGLENVTTVKRSLIIKSCDNLKSIEALSGLSGELDYLDIFNISSLPNIDGLTGITAVNNDLTIRSNASLQNVDGLANLTKVNGEFLLINSTSLTDIQGFSSFTNVKKDFTISNCDALENLNGLNNLTNVGSFRVTGNDMLKDVSAVTSLTTVSQVFFVTQNPLLSDCCVFDELLKNNTFGGPISIYNNAPGCNSEQDISLACDPTICPGDVNLLSQANVDAFPGCTKIDGNLIIEGTDIVDLSPLMPLQEVTGQISIQDCPNLTSLDGLNNLELVPVFVLSRNDDLADISALSKIGDNLTNLSITENHQLYDLMGLHGVTHLDYLLLQDNNSLSTLQGLNNLTHIGIDFKIIGNQIFDSFYALDKLVSIGGDFQVTANPNLKNFYRMLDLESIGGSFLVSLNPKLEDFTGLSGLLTADKFSVESCDGLLSLSGINQGFTTNEILVHSNGMLSDCCFLNYMLKNNIAATVDIYDNALGCNNNQEIMDGCDPVICTGVIQLTSQAQVNAFNCTEIINGILVISGSDIVDLTPLSVLTNVTHEINITNNNSLTSLAGLENTQGTKRLYIRNNPLLEDISALQSLSGDFQEIIVSNNGQLLSLSGLEGVIKVGILEILYNANLLTINGLPNLTETTNLRIVGNSSLQNVDGLDALKVVKNNFFIINNPALANLHGLNSLTNVNLQFDLKYLPMLSNFNGLEKLTTVGVFIINDNAILENINALDSSFSNAIYEINITNNPMLATCCGLFDYLQNPQSSFSQEYFSNNLPGCNSKQEIIDACGISVCTGDMVLESQAEVDAFSGCEVIEGSLQIRSPFGSDGASSDITDLSPLLSLTKVTGTIGIDNCDELYDLHGLENVTSANGIAIKKCEKVNDLSALSGISGEASVIYIYGNSSLTNIDGLEGITVLHNSLSIESNPVLQNVDGLANLMEVNYAHLTIIDNPSLENIHGLGNLEAVNTTLFIQRCDALGSLDGLNKLTTTVRLVVSGNDMLTDISALNSLTHVEYDLFIKDNPLLSDCCILTDLLNSNAIGGAITIENNAPGCNSEQDIESSCGPVICTGDVFLGSQAEVDAFPGCEVIEGQLVIEGGDITDLTPLTSLKEITKVLVIRNNSNLLTLDGLNNLTTIGGLAVVNNPLLQNLLPLSNVSSDDLSPLVFQKNKAMIDLKGLEGITGVQYLSITENSNLTTLEGLNNLATGKNDFLISHNPALENLNGLNSLHTTKDVTGIHNNDALADISALSQLNSVFVLAINSNPSLTNLSGLENLSEVWTIAITGNDALENLDAFSSLTAITGDLTILGNSALSDCCGIQPLLNGGGIAGNILIENNPFACGSGLDIINNCGPSGVDLELSMSQPNAAPAQWTTYPVTVTLSNTGDSHATGIVVHFPKPDGVVYAGGNEFTTSQGTFNPFGNQEWVVGKLKEGGTVTLTVNYFLLQSSAPIAYAQVSALNEEDIDSSPNNGTPPSVNEDDEANSVDPSVSSACSGDIVLKSQAEVNAFGNCEIIDGNLMIFGDDIIDLTPLSSLQEVKGNLNIWNNGNLTNLEGLNNLFSVGGLTLRSNPHLENLLPLSNLSGDKLAHLVISKNKELLDLKGLEGIAGLEQLFIEGNTYLTTLEGLDNLVVAEGNITIWRNSSLLNLNALANLQSVGAAFTIEQNDKLSDLSALANLGPCRDLHVLTNASLLDLSGLENISGLRDLTIAQNNGLKNLDAFSSLTSISGELTVRGNPELTDCCGIQPLLSGGNIGGPINIYLNPFACNNEQNILDNCTATVCTGDVILETQAEVDAFPGCEIIDGDLVIRPPNGVAGASSDITDLSALAGVVKVTGALALENNDLLLDLQGLNALTSVGGGLAIVECANLISIQALSGISGEIGNISILGNTSLVNLDGLEGINKVKRNLSVENNAALQNLNGLSNVDSVSTLGNFFPLYIFRNPSLVNIQGLQGLEHIGGPMVIVGCDTLENLNGLESLKTIGGFFVLAENYQLDDASALGNLLSVGGSFTMSGNPLLSDCCIFTDLINNNGINGSIDIQSNAPGCNSEQDIESSCGPVICGDIYLETQADVDAFPGCNVIDGILSIQPPVNSGIISDITDLSPLLSVTEVTGSVIVAIQKHLKDLHGLENITSAGRLVLASCDSLETIEELANLQSELKDLFIFTNPFLSNLHGLEGIKTTNCYISISDNNALQNLDALSNIETAERIEITRNSSLSDIKGLGNLTTVNDDFIIFDCDALQNLNGLEKLTTVGGLALTYNETISNIDALANLESVGDLFSVAVNPLLADCCIFSELINNNAIGGPIGIQNNAPGCNSEQDIFDFCQPQGIDLELSMTTTNLNPAIYTSSLITLTLSNTGTEPATGVKVSFPKPDGTVYTGGNEWTATQGTFNPFTNEEWTVGDLPVGGSVTLTVSYFLLNANALAPYAQVIAQNESDSDSSPSNGTPPTVNEDDEATILLNGFNGGGGISLKNHNERFRLIFDNIFPNPAKYLITMDIFSRLDQTVLLDFYDVTGRSIHRMEVQLEEGQNKIELDVSEWRSGTYNIIGRGEGLPAYGRFLKIWEE